VSIAVVIVTYNSTSTIGDCLAALDAQIRSPERIVIIDNASPAGFPSDVLKNRPSIEFVRNNQNVGFASANNQALSMLSGDVEFVALLNPDAFPEPTWLAELESAARRFPDVDAFASRMMIASSGNLVDGTGDEYHVSGLAWRSNHGMRLQPKHLVAREVFAVCAGAALYRIDALRRVGGLDDELFCYLEDIDLAFRLRRTGGRCRYVPSAVVWHVGGESTKDNAGFRLYYGHRNMIRVYLKNMPIGLLLATLPLHVAVNIAAIIRSMWRGDARVVLRAKIDALRALPRILAQRRDLLRTATAGSTTIWRHLTIAPWRSVRPRRD